MTSTTDKALHVLNAIRTTGDNSIESFLNYLHDCKSEAIQNADYSTLAVLYRIGSCTFDMESGRFIRDLQRVKRNIVEQMCKEKE